MPDPASSSVLVLLDPQPRVVPADSPVVRADDAGVLRGEGVFETVRVGGGRAFLLAEHLRRFAASAQRLALELPPAWETAVELALAGWAAPDGVLRLVCTRGPASGPPTAYVLLSPLPPTVLAAREHGVRAISLSLGVSAQFRAQARHLLAGVKSTSYAASLASVRAATEAGADDAIWISSDGQVLEAATSSVAWVSDGQLVTPPAAETGSLPGTTVAAVLDLATAHGIPATARAGTVDELRAADEAMLLSSVRGVAPLVELDGAPYAVGPVTRLLRESFEAAVTGR